MSLKTILLPFWNGVKLAFQKLDSNVLTAIHIAVEAVQKAKSYTNSPSVDIITALIPGSLDNKIVEIARKALPEILKTLLKAESVLEAIQNYQSLEGDVKSALSGAIATNLVRVATDFKIGYDDVKSLVANYYKTEVK